MSIDYTTEKFYQAVHSLVGEGTLSDRLFAAGLTLIRLTGHKGLPSGNLGARIQNVLQQLRATPAVGEEGDLRASVNAMTEAERGRLAEEILGIYTEVDDL
jgi:hypothetical protein